MHHRGDKNTREKQKAAAKRSKECKKWAKTKLLRDGAAKNAETKDLSHELDVLQICGGIGEACMCARADYRALRWREEKTSLPGR